MHFRRLALLLFPLVSSTALAQLIPDPNSARPRMLTPGPWNAEIYQLSPNGSHLRVRVNTKSFFDAGQGALVPAVVFATQLAIARWNEFGGVEPQMDWDPTDGTNHGEYGTVNIYLGSQSFNGEAAIGLPYMPNWVTGAAWGGAITLKRDVTWSDKPSGGQNLFTTIIHELGHVLGLGHSCRADGIGYGFSGAYCKDGGARAAATMAGVTMTPVWRADHGPTALDVQSLRSANGRLLPRLIFRDWYSSTTNQGLTWAGGGSTFNDPNSFASAPALASNARYYSPDALIAWRGTDDRDRWNIMFGNGIWWDRSSQRTWDSFVRGQLSVATDGYGNYLVVGRGWDVGNPNGETGHIRQQVVSRVTQPAPVDLPDTTTLDTPAVAAVRSGTSRFWVLAFINDRGQIAVRLAPLSTAPNLPVWRDAVALQNVLGGTLRSFGAISGLSLACNAFGAPDEGRCLLGYASDASRSDEGVGQVGFTRTLSFTVSATGDLLNVHNLGFAAGNRTFGSTAMAWQPQSATWLMGWSHNDSGCWFFNRMPSGFSNWPSLPPCVFQSSTAAALSPALFDFGAKYSVEYHRPE